MSESINVVLLNMEYGVHEQVSLNHDGCFTIFLNARDTFEMQRENYTHAVSHIVNGDFDRHDVQEIERNAHSL